LIRLDSGQVHRCIAGEVTLLKEDGERHDPGL
jgi:hypothetical protein